MNFGQVNLIIIEMFPLELLLLDYYISARASACQFNIVQVDFIIIYMFLLVDCVFLIMILEFRNFLF